MSFADTELKVIQRLERAGRKIKNPTPYEAETESNDALRMLVVSTGLMMGTNARQVDLRHAAGSAVAALVHFAAANDFDLSLAFAESERAGR